VAAADGGVRGQRVSGRHADRAPLLPGQRYEDWEIDDPDGKTLDEIRIIRDQIRHKVEGLIDSLAIAKR
jgi:arsenate reductase